MPRSLAALCVALFLVACGGGGGGAGTATVTPPPAAGPTPAELLRTSLEGLPLAEFYEASYEALLYRSPESIVGQAVGNDQRIHTQSPHAVTHVPADRRNNRGLGKPIPFHPLEPEGIVGVPKNVDPIPHTRAL